MELRQLRYFAKVAELKNFSEAARQLNITQSNLSQQIRLLEGESGVELLIRDSHHVKLSDVGLAFLPRAEHAISAANACIPVILPQMSRDAAADSRRILIECVVFIWNSKPP